MSIDFSKLLYVYNLGDELSLKLAQEYCTIRQIPSANMLGIDTFTKSIFSSRSEFEEEILNKIIDKISLLGGFPQAIHACVLGFRIPSGYKSEFGTISCCSALSGYYANIFSPSHNPAYRKNQRETNLSEFGIMPCCQHDMPTYSAMKKKIEEFSAYRNGISFDGFLYFDRWNIKKELELDSYASELESFEANFLIQYFDKYYITSKPIDDLRSDFGFAERDSIFWSSGIVNLNSSFFGTQKINNRIFFFNADSDSFKSFRSNNINGPSVAALLSGYQSSAGMISDFSFSEKNELFLKKKEITFDEKFNLVFDYLINRYEPYWANKTEEEGRASVLNDLGIDEPENPLKIGGIVEQAFNYTTNTDIGWFDPIVHPKNYANSVRSSYTECSRARSPEKARDRFIHYNLNAIYCQDFLIQGGNAYFGLHPDFSWQENNPKRLYHGYEPAYSNGVRRHVIHSPYGKFGSPMNSLAGNWRSFPWLTDRYTSESFQFDMYLIGRSNTTIKDLLPDKTLNRDSKNGVSVDGQEDININKEYSKLYLPAGVYSKDPYNDYSRTSGGFGENKVLVGSPWIPIDGITYSSWWGLPSEISTLRFDRVTLITDTGRMFPENPPSFVSFNRPPMSSSLGIRFDYGDQLLNSLNQLSEDYGDSVEFIAYLGCLPYGTGFEMRIPFAMYKDPTIPGNKKYFNWRLDASVSHWKEKFISPINKFANVVMDASAVIERTYHRWQPPDYTLWTNVAQSGESYVENIPVSWARKQYDFTYGASGPSPSNGIVLGVERFAQYMFKDDIGMENPARNDQRRYPGDTEPRHWCLDSDIACTLFSSLADMTLGQRKRGLEYSYSIWGGEGPKMGEIIADVSVEGLNENNKSMMSALSFFYKSFITVNSQGNFEWNRVPDTEFNGTSKGVPWINDRRFRLFYLYPTALALNFTILDVMYDGTSYYNTYNRSGWFDIRLGNILTQNMEENNIGSVVSDFPHAGRRTPVTPPQNFWTGDIETSEFELLYASMKGGIREGLDSLYFDELYETLSKKDKNEDPYIFDPYLVDPYSYNDIKTSDCWLRPEPFFQSLYQDFTILESMYFSSPMICCPMTYFADPIAKVIFKDGFEINEKLTDKEAWKELHEIFSEVSTYLSRRSNAAVSLMSRATTYDSLEDKLWALNSYRALDTNSMPIQLISEMNPAFSAWKKYSEVAYFDKFEETGPSFLQIANSLDFKFTNSFIKMNTNFNQLDLAIDSSNKEKNGFFILDTSLPEEDIGTGFFQIKAEIYLNEDDENAYSYSISYSDRSSWRVQDFDKKYIDFPKEGLFSSLKDRKIKFYNRTQLPNKQIGDEVWVKFTFSLNYSQEITSILHKAIVTS